jgi:hypothetical protein
MTRVIAILIVVVVLFAGWKFFLYWEQVKNEEEAERKQVAASVVQPESLPGLPPQYESGLRAAQQEGTAAFRNWLKTYDKLIEDPRKAWVQLDFCIAITREDPSEARRVFAEVKARTPPSSPVWPRVKELEKSYQ